MNKQNIGKIVIPNLYNTEVVAMAMKKPYINAISEKEQIINATMQNPLCGDEITWSVSIKSKSFNLITHQTIGCLLCQASSNLLQHLLDKQLISKLEQVIKENNLLDLKPNFHNEWIIFNSVVQTPNRMKCVTLPILTLQELINQFHKKN